jgi:hypothetical protein
VARQLLDPEYRIDPPRREPDGIIAWAQTLALSATRLFTHFAQAINHLQSRVGFEGHITSPTTITVGNQFTVANPSTGNYTITFQDYGTPLIITVQPINSAVTQWTVHTVASTSFKISFWDSANALVARDFYFKVRGYMEVVS